MLVHVSVIEKNICDNQKNKYEVLFPKRKIRKSNYNLEVVQTKKIKKVITVFTAGDSHKSRLYIFLHWKTRLCKT